MAPTIDYGLLASTYGFAYSTLQSNPELKALFSEAVNGTAAAPGPWSTQLFQAKLMATKWYQSTSDTAREWLILQQADPKTAAQRATARMQTIKDTAGSLGVNLTADQLKAFTDDSIMFGWTNEQVQNTLAQTWHYNNATAQSGVAAQTIDKLRQTANDYVIPLSDSALQQWVEPILAGTATADGFTEYAKQQAKNRFPGMAQAIDAGQTVVQYADPYKQAASQLLGMNPNAINFNDPKWGKALDQVDPKTGVHSTMTLPDWQTTVRTDPTYGFDNSTLGRQQGAQLSTQIAQMFGAQ